MNVKKWLMGVALVSGLLGGGAGCWAAEPLYAQDFSKAALGNPPEELLILDGQFAVKEDAGERFLELPGAPLDTYGFLFGPGQQSGVRVSARIYGVKQGRKFPAFAVGLCGAGGYRLQVSPAKQAIELFRGDNELASAPFAWKSGVWTRLALQIRKTADGYRVEGKAWAADSTEPAEPQIAQSQKDLPAAGKSGAWGMPFAGTPIRFDDLTVTQATP